MSFSGSMASARAASVYAPRSSPLRERAPGETHHRDGVPGILVGDALVGRLRLVDKYDGQQPVGLEQHLDHRLRGYRNRGRRGHSRGAASACHWRTSASSTAGRLRVGSLTTDSSSRSSIAPTHGPGGSPICGHAGHCRPRRGRRRPAGHPTVAAPGGASGAPAACRYRPAGHCRCCPPGAAAAGRRCVPAPPVAGTGGQPSRSRRTGTGTCARG